MENNIWVNDLIHTGKYTKDMHPMYGIKHLKSSKKLMSEAASKRVGSLNPFYGKKHNKKTKQRWSKLRSKNGNNLSATYGFRGKTHTEKTKSKISKSLKNNKNRIRVPVIQMDMNNKFIARYDSLVEAAKVINTSPSNIKYTIEGKFKHCKCF